MAAAKGGEPPKFDGGGIPLHDRVRDEMYRIYCEGECRIPFDGRMINCLDETAEAMFREGRDAFNELNLSSEPLIAMGNNTLIFPWCGDRVANTLAAMFTMSGRPAYAYAGIIEVEHISPQEASRALLEFVIPDGSVLAEQIPDKQDGKFDHFVPESLLCHEYGESLFDVPATRKWIDHFK